MPARTMRNRPLSDPTLPMMQLQLEVGNPSEEDFVNQVGDVYGSQHVRLYGANGQPISSSSPLPISSSFSGITSLSKAVAVAGVPERLINAPTGARLTIVQAKPANTARVAVGGADVKENAATQKGNILYPGESISLPLDPYLIYCDPQVNTEGVIFNMLG